MSTISDPRLYTWLIFDIWYFEEMVLGYIGGVEPKGKEGNHMDLIGLCGSCILETPLVKVYESPSSF